MRTCVGWDGLNLIFGVHILESAVLVLYTRLVKLLLSGFLYIASARASAGVLFYSGDPNPNSTVIRAQLVPPDGSWIYEEFRVEQPIVVRKVFSLLVGDSYTFQYFVFYQGMLPGSFGSEIAFGESLPVISGTGMYVGSDQVFRHEIATTPFVLEPGTYTFTHFTFFNTKWVSTIGENGIGPTAGDHFCYRYDSSGVLRTENRSYSMGFEGDIVAEPSSTLILAMLGSGFLWRRRS